jgi:3-deoxy-D-manno-octulosonic-acid transferase
MAAALIRSFRQIVTQDKVTVTRLLELGADPARLREGGNLKALVPVPDCDGRELEQLRRLLAGRPAWLAASTHEPEEEAVATAHQMAARSLPALLTILAPRHPERGDAVAALLAGRGLSVARRSLGEVPVVTTNVWLADTMGEMGLWLRLSPVCFIGGSIAPLGGHNPFEAAALGSAILHGPETRNFEQIYSVLDKAGGARMVVDGGAIGGALVVLIESEMARRAMTDAATAIHGQSNPDVVRLAREARVLMESAS